MNKEKIIITVPDLFSPLPSPLFLISSQVYLHSVEPKALSLSLSLQHT